MHGTLRVLDVPRFLPALRRVLVDEITRLLVRKPGRIVEVAFSEAQHKVGTITWDLRINGRISASLHLNDLKSVTIEFEDRDVFEACKLPLAIFMDGRDPETSDVLDRGTEGIDMTLVYHDNDTAPREPRSRYVTR